jgi:hypothetical protein
VKKYDKLLIVVQDLCSRNWADILHRRRLLQIERSILYVWAVLRQQRMNADQLFPDNIAVLYVLSSLDCNLGILCGCLPEIRTLIASLNRSAREATARIHRPRTGRHTAVVKRQEVEEQQQTYEDPTPAAIEAQQHNRSNRTVIVVSEARSRAGPELMSINVMLDEEVWKQQSSANSKSSPATESPGNGERDQRTRL